LRPGLVDHGTDAEPRWSVRRALEDGLITAAGVLMLLAVLVSVDQRVRERLTDVLRPGNPTAEIANMSSKASKTAAILATAIKDQSIDQAPLVVFVAAGGGLFLAMLRL
jgi:hypothetical protein